MAVAGDVEEELAAEFAALFPHLDERQRRLAMGARARSLGHGGITVVARAAGVNAVTVSRGVTELEAGGEGSPYLTGVPQVAPPCPDRPERHCQLRRPGLALGASRDWQLGWRAAREPGQLC